MRNLGIILAFCWAVLPTNSLALGLGEITVNSFLNQPLAAEIEVISARPGEIDDLIVTLATQEAFTRAGLSRPRYLSDMQFEVQRSEDGESAVILVKTKNGVKEPFLNFLVEADWQKGRVLREFTVLLDPPFFAEQPAPVETAPEPVFESDSGQPIDDSVSTPIADSTVDDDQQQMAQPIASDDSSAAQTDFSASTASAGGEVSGGGSTRMVAEGDVAVSKGDTLWGIASRYLDADQSMAQVMLAFQRANPDAFNDGNINNLREGAILRAPSQDEITALSKQEAYAEVLVQNGLWDEYVARVSGVSPAVAADGSGAAAGGTDAAGGELSLLVPGDGESDTAGGGSSADVDRLRTQLAIAEEELDAARIENRELESRIAELQARLSKIEELQKMVEIEDDSLAQMQADQAEQESAVADSVAEALRADEEALVEELLAEEAAAQALEQGGTDAMTDDAMADDAMAEPTDGTDAMTDDAMGEDAISEQPQPQVAQPPAPVIVTQPARDPSIFDGILPPDIIDMIPAMPSMGGLLGDPLILGGAGGVILLLLVWLFMRRRKGEDDDAPLGGEGEDLFAGDADDELTPIHLAESGDSDQTEIKVPTEEDLFEAVEADKAASAEIEEDDFGSTAVISAADMSELDDTETAPAPAAPADAEQDDVLNEVDVYLAYGLYDNAEELLTQNLTENPDRADYRSKLLDTYFATKKADAFVAEAETLKSMGDPAGRYWDRVQVMGYELAPDNPLFSDAADSSLTAADLEFVKPQEADFDLGASGEDGTNFSTTDFNLGEEDTGGDFMATAAISEKGEAGQVAETEQIPQLDEDLPDFGDDDTNLRLEPEPDTFGDADLPDEIGEELEFSIDDALDSADEDAAALPGNLDLGMDNDDEQEAGAAADLGDLEMDFDDLGDDIDDGLAVDLGEDDTGSRADASEVDLTGEFEVDLGDAVDEDEIIPMDEGGEVDEDSVELDIAGFDSEDDTAFADNAFAETAVIAPDTAVVTPDFGDSGFGEDDDDDGDATSLLGDELNLETGVIKLPTDDSDGGLDDDEDISVVDFGDDDFEVELEDEDTGGTLTTGTFAPGDFDEPTGETDMDGIDDIDDISELMMPDDVDEVSTKLDLARAFIDMGDSQGARGSLEEVLAEGNDEQKAEAKTLLDQI